MTGAVSLTDEETAILRGEDGTAKQEAMALVARAAELMGAPRLVPISFAHIDACFYAGRAHLDFAEDLLARGARFEVPSWTNTIPVRLEAPEPRADQSPTFLDEARALARAYMAMGAKGVWTCAPYQLPGGPGLGDQIIVGESNAVAYYNSAVGARTNKYGDFLDVACALVGRAPEAGLHTDAGRRGTRVLDVTELPEALRATEAFYHTLGALMGRWATDGPPVIVGLAPNAPADSLKALAAAGGATGGVTLFHAVGVTPEAPTLDAALQGEEPTEVRTVRGADLVAARDRLSTAEPGPLAMIALGTPHFSFTEFQALDAALAGRRIHSDVRLVISTSRAVAALAEEAGLLERLRSAGAEILTDTCTYFSPAIRGMRGQVMTNAAKWAYYAPGMLPVTVAFGSLQDCAESAVAGAVRRDPAFWSDAFWGVAETPS